MKFHVFIIPPEPVLGEIKEIINELARKYNSLKFEPHLTLVANIDQPTEKIIMAVQNAVRGIDRLELTMNPVSFSTTFWQSVLVPVKPTALLMQLNVNIKKSLNMENRLFMPHLSLLYGDQDMNVRADISENIKLKNTFFTVNSLVIVRENSDYDVDWEHVKVITFGQEAKKG
jgi:2'-5' RNA ligase